MRAASTPRVAPLSMEKIMGPFTEFADWWEKNRRESNQILEEWVQDNPQWWTVGIAATTATFMDLGAGMVDVLRIGDGVKEGGVAGYGKDALRLLSIAGPLGKAGAMLGRLKYLQGLKLAISPANVGGPCTFRAINNALSIGAGKAQNIFLTAKEAARALGKPLKSFARIEGDLDIAAWVDELIPFLRQQGVKITQLKPASLEALKQMMKGEHRVVVFAVKWKNAAGEASEHSIIAVRNAMGRVRYADYGGKLFDSIEDLIRAKPSWGGLAGKVELYTGKTMTGAAVVGSRALETMGRFGDIALKAGESAVIALAGIDVIETKDEGADFAVPIEPVAVPIDTQIPLETLQTSFEAFKARERNRKVIRLDEIVITPRTRKRRKLAPANGGPPAVKWLTGVQYRLNAAGFAAGEVDGLMGPKTRGAVESFQHAYKLRVDGIPGPKTQAKLVEVCGY